MISARTVHAQIEIGTWVQQSGQQVGMTLTVEACCGAGGRRLTYRNPGSTEVAVIVESRMDGTDAPMIIGGKPSGQTMAITRADTNHATSIVKMQGKVFSKSKATLSPDGKKLTVENDIPADVGKPLKQVEVWVKK